jgi:hypothetical protein
LAAIGHILALFGSHYRQNTANTASQSSSIAIHIDSIYLGSLWQFLAVFGNILAIFIDKTHIDTANQCILFGTTLAYFGHVYPCLSANILPTNVYYLALLWHTLAVFTHVYHQKAAKILPGHVHYLAVIGTTLAYFGHVYPCLSANILPTNVYYLALLCTILGTFWPIN